MWQQCKNLILKVLHTDDSPHKIAWGMAIGIFVAWLPIIGIQMVVAGLLALILRGNTIAAVAACWVTNPYTAIPIYWFNYLVGHWLVGGEPITFSWFTDFMTRDQTRSWWQYMVYCYGKMSAIFWPLWIGSIMLGLVFGKLCYWATIWWVVRYRERHGAGARASAERITPNLSAANSESAEPIDPEEPIDRAEGTAGESRTSGREARSDKANSSLTASS